MTHSNEPVRIWCLRHAESTNVSTGTAGAVPSAELTSLGRQQATRAALALTRALDGEPLAAGYPSTALRARQTALALPVPELRPLAELVEVGIGHREGSTDPAVHRETAEVLHAWVVEGDLDRRVADGESGHQVLARMRTGLQRIVRAHPGRSVALVGHVASLTVALSHLCGLGARVWGHPLAHAEPFLVVGQLSSDQTEFSFLVNEEMSITWSAGGV